MNHPAPNLPSTEEMAFLVLARRWEADVATRAETWPTSRIADLTAFAATSLAASPPNNWTQFAESQIARNIEICDRRPAPSVDSLPWRLSREIKFPSALGREALAELTANLDHPGSDTRVWIMELAWVVRHHLDPAEALPRLLDNVASTLVGVTMAWDLAAAVSETPHDLARVAFQFEGGPYQRQYEERRDYYFFDRPIDSERGFVKTETAYGSILDDTFALLRRPPDPQLDLFRSPLDTDT